MYLLGLQHVDISLKHSLFKRTNFSANAVSIDARETSSHSSKLCHKLAATDHGITSVSMHLKNIPKPRKAESIVFWS